MSDTRQTRRPEKSTKYVDLKINGRLFPSFILANFPQYKLEEVLHIPGNDACNITTDTGEIKKELRKYQLFISHYMDYRSPYRTQLLFHFLGVGKTATAINVYNVLYNYTPGWNVFILIKASIKGEWLDNLKEWLRKDEYEFRNKNIIFIHYDSPFADRNFLDAFKNVDSSKKSLYMIDEVHNFIRNVYSNISTGTGKRAQVIYDYIIQDQRENPDTRVIAISGTPAINNPFELALLFNLLRPNIFPRSESEFNQQFITSGSFQTLSKNSKNLFQRRIMGLVSYYAGATKDLYASKSIHYVDVPMSSYQEDIYNYYEDIEAKIAMSSQGRGGATVYKSYTRQACNFVFPALSQKVNGEGRPRPAKFKISEREAQKLNEGESLKGDKGQGKIVSEYLKVLELYINSFDGYLEQTDEQDRKNNYTIIDDVTLFLKKYERDFERFVKEEGKKSKLFDVMYISSAKILNIIFNIMGSPGPVIMYSNYVLMEGIEIFKIYLKYFGFYNFMTSKESIPGKVGYVEFHGGIKDIRDRFRGRDEFNKSENKYGTIIKIILISPAGAEGLSLRNVRQIHIMEPYWNEVRITQMIGRGIRQCSHKDLPVDQRHVDIFRYKSVRQNKEKWTTDQYIEDLARSKEGLIQSFLDAVKEVAVDCNLFKPHNMISQEYKCFQFEEPSLFDPRVAPAYREDLGDDVKMDNGSNSIKSDTIKIKVRKIIAVIQITKPDETGRAEYSSPKNYWLYDKSGVVYDIDLYYAVGRVAKEEDGANLKLNKDTYIIDYMIPIPLIEE